MPHSTSTASEPLAPFVVRHVAEVPPPPPEQRWLIEHLWLSAGVGILGGAPKVCKTYLAAELSIAVAADEKALGRFNVHRPGPVIFYGAEDSLPAMRERFQGLAMARSLDLASLPIYLLDVPALRLDRPKDLARLRAAIEQFEPRLLVLDPFVRMARIDENSSADVSAVLGSLREIQRAHDLAVLLVHHARKSPAANPAQALRGSSDFAAWSDSNLYITRHTNRLTLHLEHRSAPAPDPLDFRLIQDPAPHLGLLGDQPDDNAQLTIEPLQNEIIDRLTTARRPMPTVELRKVLCKRKEDVVRALADLADAKLVTRSQHGWILTSS